MTIKFHTSRYAWVCVCPDEASGSVGINTFVSPDRNAVHLDTIPTPFKYQLTRNDVRYYLSSEVQLSQNLAIRIAGQLYDAEFILAPQMKMKANKRR